MGGKLSYSLEVCAARVIILEESLELYIQQTKSIGGH